MMAKNKRILAMLMAVAIFAIIISSALFLAEEAHHDCIGDGCQICFQMNVCRGILKSLSLVLHVAVAVLLAACISCGRFWPCGKSTHQVTLVTLKVKLSN